MSDTTEHELRSLITNMSKSPKSFDISEIEQPFRFAWFEEFPWLCYYWWEDRAYCLSCVLFVHQKWQTTVKIFKKHQNVSKETQKRDK